MPESVSAVPAGVRADSRSGLRRAGGLGFGALLLAAALSAGPVAAQTSAAADPLAATAVQLRDRALTDTVAWDVVESLTTEVGPRPAGSPAMLRARDWGLAKLRALGFQNVRAEEYAIPGWVRGAERAEVLGGSA